MYIWNSIKYSNFLEDDRLQKIVILCEFEEIFVIGSCHVESLGVVLGLAVVKHVEV